MMNREEATRLIALTLAEVHREPTPGPMIWRKAKELTDKFVEAGHIPKEDRCTVCGLVYDGICYPDPMHSGHSFCGRH